MAYKKRQVKRFVIHLTRKLRDEIREPFGEVARRSSKHAWDIRYIVRDIVLFFALHFVIKRTTGFDLLGAVVTTYDAYLRPLIEPILLFIVWLIVKATAFIASGT